MPSPIKKNKFNEIIATEHITPLIAVSFTQSKPRQKFDVREFNTVKEKRMGKYIQYLFIGGNIFVNTLNARKTIENKKPISAYFRPIAMTSACLFVLSKVNNRTDSQIFKVNKGINKLIVVVNKSYVPYSTDVKNDVYKGTRKKASNFVPNWLIVNKPMFLNKYRYPFIFTLKL